MSVNTKSVKRKRKFVNKFKAIHDREVKWQEGAALKMLTLPKGLKVKILNHDPLMKRFDM